MGDVPGINPFIQSAVKWGQYISGRNPRDEFRGRDIIGKDEQLVGGWDRLKPMLMWQTDQLGELGRIIRVSAEWNRNITTGEETTTTEKIINSIPGLSRMVKVTDRGAVEQQWEDVAEEDRDAAAIRLSMPRHVKDLQRERYRLNRLGTGRLDPADRSRRTLLNAWYGSVYRPALENIQSAVESGDDTRANELREELNRETERVLNNQSQAFLRKRRRDVLATLRRQVRRQRGETVAAYQKRRTTLLSDKKEARQELTELNRLSGG
jgi:hypothetical protein